MLQNVCHLLLAYLGFQELRACLSFLKVFLFPACIFDLQKEIVVGGRQWAGGLNVAIYLFVRTNNKYTIILKNNGEQLFSFQQLSNF